jgi:hypothetical protein
MESSRERMPRFIGQTYPLAPAIEEIVGAIAERRRRVAYPRWFLRLLPVRQLLASRLFERQAAREMPEVVREYEQLIAERGESAASATERTRELAGL